jgi:ATP-dependent protease HslVU (ClpYQ) ATPase subunit
VEATKFTEVGFHGRDVDQIIRDLVDAAIILTRTKLRLRMQTEVRIVVVFLPWFSRFCLNHGVHRGPDFA